MTDFSLVYPNFVLLLPVRLRVQKCAGVDRSDEKACEGASTLTDGDFEECLSCGTRIRWDLVNHPFWGFQNCHTRRSSQKGTSQ